MMTRVHRRIAIPLVAFYALGQAALAHSSCGLDRGSMAQSMAMPTGDTCDDCVTVAADALTATCIANCTADLQLAPGKPVSIPNAAYEPLLTLPKARLGAGPPVVAYPLPLMIARRILLHSFQV